MSDPRIVVIGDGVELEPLRDILIASVGRRIVMIEGIAHRVTPREDVARAIDDEIRILADRTAPHMRAQLERMLDGIERGVDHDERWNAPWRGANRKLDLQREHLLDQIATERALRPTPLPRPPAPKAFREYRIVDSEGKRERRAKNKAARKARKGRR